MFFPPTNPLQLLVAEGLRPRLVQPPQRQARQAPARRRQLHAVDAARRARGEEELQRHLSGAHAWDGSRDGPVDFGG